MRRLGACAGLALVAAPLALARRRRPARVQASADEFSLALSRQSIRSGSAIVELVNYGEDDHDLALRRIAPGARTYRIGVVHPGGTGTLSRSLRPGRYRLWCTLADHRARGMVATLFVRPGRVSPSVEREPIARLDARRGPPRPRRARASRGRRAASRRARPGRSPAPRGLSSSRSRKTTSIGKRMNMVCTDPVRGNSIPSPSGRPRTAEQAAQPRPRTVGDRRSARRAERRPAPEIATTRTRTLSEPSARLLRAQKGWNPWNEGYLSATDIAFTECLPQGARVFCGNRRSVKDESGQMIVFAIITMVVLIAMAGFAVDVGHAYLVQRQLQSATDAAALAGALDLPDKAAATQTANDYGPAPGKRNPPHSNDNAAITVETKCVTAIPGCSIAAGTVNAISVHATSNVKTVFAKIARPRLIHGARDRDRLLSVLGQAARHHARARPHRLDVPGEQPQGWGDAGSNGKSDQPRDGPAVR